MADLLHNRFDELGEAGFMDALIALKRAPSADFKHIKPIFNHLEKVMIHNISVFDLESLAQMVVAYNDRSSGELGQRTLPG